VNKTDLQALIDETQKGRDALFSSMNSRTTQGDADRADIVAAQARVDEAARNRQAAIDDLAKRNQVEADAETAAQQAEVDADNKDITDQTDTLTLDQQALDAIDAALAGLKTLLGQVPAAPATPPPSGTIAPTPSVVPNVVTANPAGTVAIADTKSSGPVIVGGTSKNIGGNVAASGPTK
jgi:hypothetical protein